MKQHITIEQLNELTIEQKERLREWWKPADEDWYTNGETAYAVIEYPKIDDNCLPLLSIGQCIELLQSKDKNGDYWLIGKIELRPYNNGKPIPGTVSWVIHLIQQGALEIKVFDKCYSKELIDALWQAVKEVAYEY